MKAAELLQKLRRKLTGRAVWESAARVEVLERRLKHVEELLELLAGDEDALWLYRNREERMDATRPMFDELRRRFHLARYEFAAGHVRGSRVADIACGTGYGTEILVLQGGAGHATGVDRDPAAVDYARRRHGSRGTTFVCAPAEETGLQSACLDAIVSMETIEHVEDDAPLLREFHRLLKPEGRLICSTPNAWALEDAEHHHRSYELSSFRRMLEPCFDVREMWNQNSGSPSKYNHGQPAGMRPTTAENAASAECYVAVCSRRDT